MPTTQKQREEDGNTTITTLLLVIPLSLLTACLISTGSIYLRWITLSSLLTTAREDVMTSGFQMMLKSSDRPGKMLADKLATELRYAGVDDDLTVWFIESADPSLGDATRAFALYAVVETDYKASNFFESVTIPCSTSASIVAYASSRVYKPPTSDLVEAYHFAKGSITAACTVAPAGRQTPQPLIDACDEAERRACSY